MGIAKKILEALSVSTKHQGGHASKTQRGKHTKGQQKKGGK